jgi:hypothetical protein
MTSQTILTNLVSLIGRAEQLSDFHIASTMVRFSDLNHSDKIKLITLIAEKRIKKGY